MLAAHRAGWDPEPGLALVRLAQGDVAGAADSIRDALEHPVRVPSKERPPNNDLQRAPLLEAQVEIAIAAGDIDRARSAADELDLVAARFESKALVAGAAHARGRVRLADGDATGAERSLSEAARLWNEVGAPYEAARARLGLADAHHASGRHQRADMERRAARTILDEIAAGPAAHVTPRDTRDEEPVASSNVFRRDGDYWTVIFDGHTVHVRDLKGMHYLARLLADPGREFHVLDLVAGETRQRRTRRQQPNGAPGAIGTGRRRRDARHASQERLPPTPRRDRRRHRAGATPSATTSGPPRPAPNATSCFESSRRAVGLGGRDRRAASASERARAGVTRAIRQAITRIADHHPQLGEHLSRTIRTGTYCAYMPDPHTPAGWES